ncbi:hypothetical protein D3C80_1631750 [compost metagenome]
MGVFLVDLPLADRGETNRAAATAFTVNHPLAKQLGDCAGHVLTADAGHLGDVRRRDAGALQVVTGGLAMDCQGDTKLAA